METDIEKHCQLSEIHTITSDAVSERILANTDKILLPLLHIKLGIVKSFIKKIYVSKKIAMEPFRDDNGIPATKPNGREKVIGYDPLFRIRIVADELNKVFDSIVKSESLCVDEQMCSTKAVHESS